MNISDLLNPENTSSSSSYKPPGETPPDPNRDRDTDTFLHVDENNNTKYKEFADYLENKRNSVLEYRISVDAPSKSTTYTDLGISFRSPRCAGSP